MPIIESRIKRECVPFWRTFKDPVKQKEYVEYRRDALEKGPARNFFFIAVLFLANYKLIFDDIKRIGGTSFTTNQLICRSIMLPLLVVRSIPFMCVLFSVNRGGFIDTNELVSRMLAFLGLSKHRDCVIFADIVLIAGSLSYSLIVIALTASGHCPTVTGHGSQWNHMYCNTNHDEREPPTGPLMYLVISLPFLQLLLTGSCWAVIMISYAIEFMGFALSLCIAGNVSAFVSYDRYAFWAFMIKLYLVSGYEDQLLRTFVGLKVQEELLKAKFHSENEKALAEMQATEIRYLVANTAHDLKTPLQAIGMGAEDILRRLHGFTSKLSDFVLAAAGKHATKATTSASAIPLGSLAPLTERSAEHDDLEMEMNVNADGDDDSVMYVVSSEDKDGMMDSANIITATVVFMAMTINRAIDFTKASHDIKLVPSYETVKLEAVLSWPVSIIRSLQGRTSLEVLPVPGHICPFVITDKGWLTENLLGLFSNAIKYSTGGTVLVRTSLVETNSLSRVDKEVDVDASCPVSSMMYSLCIEVEDDGIGVDDDVKGKLFAPFSQAQRMATGGTGLGLYSLRKRVEALGGSCGVRDRPDGKQGSVFWFTFPYRPDELSADQDIGRSISQTPDTQSVISPLLSPRSISECQSRSQPPLSRCSTRSGGKALSMCSSSVSSIRGSFRNRSNVTSESNSALISPRSNIHRCSSDPEGSSISSVADGFMTGASTRRGSGFDVSDLWSDDASRRSSLHDASAVTLAALRETAQSIADGTAKESTDIELTRFTYDMIDSAPEPDSSSSDPVSRENSSRLNTSNNNSHSGSSSIETRKKRSSKPSTPTSHSTEGSNATPKQQKRTVQISNDFNPVAPAPIDSPTATADFHAPHANAILKSSSIGLTDTSDTAATTSESQVSKNSESEIKFKPALPPKQEVVEEEEKVRGPASVLVVDDSLPILKMCSKSLIREGFVVTTAENGSIALNILKERAAEFDVVLLDLQMPVMDGLEMTRRYRAVEVAEDSAHAQEPSCVAMRHLPIIGMSANSDDETKKRALEVGMDHFIPKPFSIEKFKETFAHVG